MLKRFKVSKIKIIFIFFSLRRSYDEKEK